MATCAHTAQAAGMAAAICRRRSLQPRDLSTGEPLAELRRELQRAGQYIPGARLEDPDDLARRATITATSRFLLGRLPDDGSTLSLREPWAQMVPLPAGLVPAFTFGLHTGRDTHARFELRTSARPGGFTPDRLLDARTVAVPAGTNVPVRVAFSASLDAPAYGFVCLPVQQGLAAHLSALRVTGLLAVRKRHTQTPAAGIGVDAFDLWCPERRPAGHNLAFRADPGLDVYGPANVANGVARPTAGPNAWVADPGDPAPGLTLAWPSPVTIGRVVLGFDTDWDHPMESVQMGHPERAMPFCVRSATLRDGSGRQVTVDDNHATRREVVLAPPLVTDRLHVLLGPTWGGAPAALFEVRCYEE